MTKQFQIFKKVLLCGVLCLLAMLYSSVADARPSTQSYTCEGVRHFIDQRGTVVMNTKNASVYRKFYAPHYQCPFSTEHTAHRVPTKSGTCTLYICREPREDMFGRKWPRRFFN